jgi:ribonuclease P protein subunit RPR2
MAEQLDVREIAEERIRILLNMARDIYETDQLLSKRYVSLARKIGMRHKIPVGGEFCRKCNTVFLLGKTAKKRVGKNKMVCFVCLKCGAVRRKGFGKKG